MVSKLAQQLLRQGEHVNERYMNEAEKKKLRDMTN